MPKPTLEQFMALALEAGREIINVRAGGFEAQTKDDGSLVTMADQHAELIIEQGLAGIAPEIPMIGEEAVADGRIPECGHAFFLVDPLDGTRGFAKGGDEFTVNIALIENAQSVMGVVYAPATGELYAGEPGRAVRALYDVATGAEREALASIAPTAEPAQWRIIASDYSGRNEKTAAFISALDGAQTHASSSVKFCRLAEGAADIYPRFGDVSEWDAAAGHAVLNAAGGGIMRLDGEPLRYGDRDGKFLIHGFVAYSNEAAKRAALDALKR